MMVSMFAAGVGSALAQSEVPLASGPCYSSRGLCAQKDSFSKLGFKYKVTNSSSGNLT